MSDPRAEEGRVSDPRAEDRGVSDLRAEDQLIETIRARIARDARDLPAHVLQGIGDDCAVTRGDDGTLRLCTTDMLVEEVHFRLRDLSAAELGRKALAVNLSDIAAMGGWALDAYVAVALPAALDGRFLAELEGGMADLAAEHGLAVLGGDTTRSPGPLVLSITVIGAAEQGKVLLRSGARPGDRLYVSGPLGDSAAGLHALTQGHGDDDELARPLIARHLAPRARLELGRRLAQSGAARAAMDLSDGLSTDLPRLLAASSVSARVDAERVPLSAALKRYCEREELDPLALALHGGEDYELLLSGDAGLAQRVEGLIEIGEILPRAEACELVLHFEGQERALCPGGWDPFRGAR